MSPLESGVSWVTDVKSAKQSKSITILTSFSPQTPNQQKVIVTET